MRERHLSPARTPRYTLDWHHPNRLRCDGCGWAVPVALDITDDPAGLRCLTEEGGRVPARAGRGPALAWHAVPGGVVRGPGDGGDDGGAAVGLRARRPNSSALQPLHHAGQHHPRRVGPGQGLLNGRQVLPALPGQQGVLRPPSGVLLPWPAPGPVGPAARSTPSGPPASAAWCPPLTTRRNERRVRDLGTATPGQQGSPSAFRTC
jgi:hypothetical protein